MLTTVSCEKNEEVNSEKIQTINSNLNFAAKNEMQTKIAEIQAFKKTQEDLILQKIIKRNNLKFPLSNDLKNIPIVTLNEFNRNLILDDLKFYHNEKLKAVYQERTHLGFTSIQSIVDEINSLKLLNTKRYNELILKYSKFISNNEYETKSKYDENYSNIIDEKGFLQLNSKKVNLSNFETTNNNASRASSSTGLVASGYNNFIKILYRWEIGDLRINPENYSNYVTLIGTQINCFVLSNSGYVGYPCFYYTNNNSIANFYSTNAPYSANGVLGACGVGSSVRFPNNDYGSYVTSATLQISNGVCDYVGAQGTVTGIFLVPVAGTSYYLNVSGTSNF